MVHVVGTRTDCWAASENLKVCPPHRMRRIDRRVLNDGFGEHWLSLKTPPNSYFSGEKGAVVKKKLS